QAVRHVTIVRIRPDYIDIRAKLRGKSSIIQSLLLIRQSLQASQTSAFRLISRGEYADLGSFKSLLHKHDLARTLRIRIGYDVVRRQARHFVGTRLPGQFSRRLTLE